MKKNFLGMSVDLRKAFETIDHVDLITFTEEILKGKLHFLCSVVKFFSG